MGVGAGLIATDIDRRIGIESSFAAGMKSLKSQSAVGSL